MRRVRTVWIIRRDVPERGVGGRFGGVQYWHVSRWTRARLAATEYITKPAAEKLAFKFAALDPENIGKYEVVRITRPLDVGMAT